MALHRATKNILAWTGLVGGLAAVGGLVAWWGFAEVADVLSAARWGFVLLVLVFVPHLLLITWSWRCLFAPGAEPALTTLTRAMWIGSSVNALVPSATIGGEVVKARLLAMWGVSRAVAAASVVADKTVQALTVVLWALVGVALLVGFTAGGATALAALAGVAVFALAVGGFMAVQHAGVFVFLARVAGFFGSREWADRLRARGARLDGAVREIYRRPGRVALACTVRLAGRLVLAGEVWLAAWLMGYPITFAEAVMLNSIALALRGAAFVVPSGFGVQEGSFVVIGGLIGLAPEVMLAVSLATRARELVVSLPGLLAWQHSEGRAVLRRRAGPQS